MRNNHPIITVFAFLLLTALACQRTSSELTPEVVSISEPIATTSLSSLPTATNIPTALPTTTLAPPLGLFSGQVAFTDTTSHLALLDMLTGEITPLTIGDDVGAGGSMPFWSGDGSRFTYQFWNAAINDRGLAMLEVASHEIQVVLEDFNLDLLSFNYAVSPDGSFATYDTWNEGGGTDIWRLDLTSGERIILTVGGAFIHAQNSALSPDGRRIAYQFTGENSSLADIRVMNADGSGKINLTLNDEYRWDDFLPTWTPDSARVAFFRSYIRCAAGCNIPDPTTDTPGWPPGLWMVNADGSGEELVVELPFDKFPHITYDWASQSPDGQYVAYQLSSGPPDGPIATQIWVLEIPTGELRKVFEIITPHYQTLYMPTWSPDSRALMVNHRERGDNYWTFTTYVAAVDGSAQWTLFEATIEDGSSEWQLQSALGGYDAAWSP